MRHPPRLLVRTMIATFATVVSLLLIVVGVVLVDARARTRAAEVNTLRASGRIFTALEQRRQRDELAAAIAVADNPALRTAVLTLARGPQASNHAGDRARRREVQRAADRLAALTSAGVLAILDPDNRVIASAGPSRTPWGVGTQVQLPAHGAPGVFHGVVTVPAGAFRVTAVPLRAGSDTPEARRTGMLVIGGSLDETYARDLAALAHAGVVITVGDRVIGRTVPEAVASALAANRPAGHGTSTLAGEEYAHGQLLALGPARVYLLTSVDEAARSGLRATLAALASIAIGGILLAAFASLWLGRTLTGPIDKLSRDIATMTASREFGTTLEATGTSREMDALTAAFNDLMGGLTRAEADTRAASVGAIRALATALDARDPYTAGHSERVSAVSVLMARHMGLPETEVDIIRLGALLHDIGKIGVADAVLRKTGPLTPDEFAQIRQHPGLGARILREVPCLAPHIPIVELHHERPDGRGYPFGLQGDDIPLAARIVHVADAYDAITSARAYRSARAPRIAIAELRRHTGTDFDGTCVEALCATMKDGISAPDPELRELLGMTA